MFNKQWSIQEIRRKQSEGLSLEAEKAKIEIINKIKSIIDNFIWKNNATI